MHRHRGRHEGRWQVTQRLEDPSIHLRMYSMHELGCEYPAGGDVCTCTSGWEKAPKDELGSLRSRLSEVEKENDKLRLEADSTEWVIKAGRIHYEELRKVVQERDSLRVQLDEARAQFKGEVQLTNSLHEALQVKRNLVETLRAQMERAKGERYMFARAVVEAEWKEGRGHLEEVGCPWCSRGESNEEQGHDVGCPVNEALAALRETGGQP